MTGRPIGGRRNTRTLSRPSPRKTAFVGREEELVTLRAALRETATGSGRLVLLAGEPGIGKTRLCREFESYAVAQRAQVLWGGSNESSGAPPYWPWLQLIRQWARTNTFAVVADLSDANAGELARLFPELLETTGGHAPPPTLEAASAQFRLFDALVALFGAMSARTPLVIILEDLHWTDGPSVQLLEHVAHALRHLRLLVIATFRDTDLSRTDPLTDALAELNRDPGFERLVLGGLSSEAVRTYIRRTAGVEPSTSVVRMLHDATEGNPFFLNELVQFLSAEGTLASPGAVGLRVPKGVKEALDRRLGRLSGEAHELVLIAAVVGREFTYDILDSLRHAGLVAQHLHDGGSTGAGPDDGLVMLIEDAVRNAIIEEMESPGSYRFTHALMQETLLGELSSTRRALLHGRVAEALEQHWGVLAEQRASQLAVHFLAASALAPSHLERARPYARLAAEQAERQFAWAEAERWYRVATDGVDDPDPKVLRALANAAANTADFFDPRVVSLFVAAIDAYRRSGDRVGLAETVTELPAGVLSFPFAGPLLDEAVAPPETAAADVRARLRLQLCNRYAQIGESDAGVDEMERREAELMALATDPEVSDGAALRCWAISFRANRTRDLVLAASQSAEAAELYAQIGRPLDACGALVWATSRAGACGSWRLARSYAEKLMGITDHFRLVGPGRVASSMIVVMDLLQATGPTTAELDSVLGRSGFGSWWTLVRGRAEEAAAMLVPVAPGEGRAMLMGRTAPRAAVLFEVAGPAAAGPDFATWAATWRSHVTGPANRANAFSYVSRALVAMGDDDLCREVYEEVRHWRNWCGYATGIGVDAGSGMLALRLGLVDEARQAFEDGLGWAEREGCPIEVGRNLAGLARVADLEGDAELVRSLLDRAEHLFWQLGAKLYLGDVLAHRAELTSRNTAKVGAPDAANLAPAVASPLSPRESEVLRLLATGSLNREIAGLLVISERTVERHVSNIYRKLDVRGKAEATAWAVRSGLA